MFERILVPLLLTDILDSVDGRTRFQKLTFLIQKDALENEIKDLDFGYEIYLHGPFSRELSTVIDTLTKEGYLEEKTTETSSGYTKYLYRLTSKGKELVRDAKKKRLLSAKMMKSITKIIDRYGTMPLSQLVEEAYKQF
jgi:uncharacterized protein YwgA